MLIFGIYAVFIVTIFYLPLMVSGILGALISLGTAYFIAYKLSPKYEKNIFEIAKETGKTIAQVFVPPNKVYMFLADKDPATKKVSLKITKEGKSEKISWNLTPNQEFFLEVPEGKIEKTLSIWDIINRGTLVLQDPIKQIFKIKPYDVELVMFVFPTEVLTQEQLKALNLEKVAEDVEKIKEQDSNNPNRAIEKEIKVPVYSPIPYALSSDIVNHISAKHRFSTIANILEQTKSLLRQADQTISVMGGSSLSWLKTLMQNRQAFMTLVVVIIFFLIMLFTIPILNNIVSGFAQMTTPTNIPTFNKTFP